MHLQSPPECVYRNRTCPAPGDVTETNGKLQPPQVQGIMELVQPVWPD